MGAHENHKRQFGMFFSKIWTSLVCLVRQEQIGHCHREHCLTGDNSQQKFLWHPQCTNLSSCGVGEGPKKSISLNRRISWGGNKRLERLSNRISHRQWSKQRIIPSSSDRKSRKSSRNIFSSSNLENNRSSSNFSNSSSSLSGHYLDDDRP